MKDQILKNKILNYRLDRDGFVKLRLLQDSHIDAIKKLYEETRVEHERVGKTLLFHATQDVGNPYLTDYIDKKTKEILSPIIEKHFVNYKIIMANFILKTPGIDSELKPHQDWTFVDESKYFTFGFWTPIEDTNEENGNLQILPGSHKIIPTLRVNYNYPCAFSEVTEIVKKHLVDVKTEKGETILLNHSVLHGSKPNLSKSTRVALSLGITHKDAQILHLYCDKNNEVSEYHVDIDELKKIKYGIAPDKKFLKSKKKVSFPIINKSQFQDWLNNKTDV
jgi:hypothetical protein